MITPELTPCAHWVALGTDVTLAVADPGRLELARQAAVAELEAFDLACSRFRPDSELSAVHASAPGWAPAGPRLVEAVEKALAFAALTGGAVDPTVGAALRLAGYDRDFLAVTDTGPLLIDARPVPGWRMVAVDAERSRVRVPEGVELDLGAVGKGLAADRASSVAAEAAGAPVVLSVGGDVALAGGAPEAGWAVAVREGNDDEGEVVLLHGGGLATSSTLARRWRRGGVELHHILDPATGLPVRSPWRTATVAGASCAAANAASTAAIVLGDAAPAWLAARGLVARLVAADGSVVKVGGWP